MEKENNSLKTKVKGVIKKNLYTKYFFYSKKQFKAIEKNNILETDILVPFFPFRHDYELLIYPIVEELEKSQLTVTLIVPRDALGSHNLQKLKGKVQILIYEDLFIKFNTYKETKTFLEENLKHIQNDYIQKGYSPSALQSMIVNYAYDYVLATKLLKKTKPKVVYSLHFIFNTGWLDALKKEKVQIHLMQHGFFNGEIHDFMGSTMVHLWGEYHQERLKKLDSTLKTTVVGNPKLLRIKKSYINTENKVRENLKILFVSSGHTFTNNKIYDLTLNALEGIKELQSDYNIELIYKLHPSENFKDYKRWLSQKVIKHNEIIQSNDIYEQILNAKIVIGAVSTVVNEAAFLERLCIRLFDESLINDIDDGIIKIRSKTELKSLLLNSIDENYYNDLITEQTSKSTRMFVSSYSVEKEIARLIKQHI
ncbi:hypothetical protein V8V54_26815 [Priestia megaterium]|uniref:hypothetical protein n=1 Tax=Priestia megaterium TaxID=1404 RepID=UPI00300902DC